MSAPSAWSRRLPVAVLALAGCGISVYLSLYQCHVISSVWDPVFSSESSKAVLRSPLSRAMPVPDAAVGAVAYAAEAVLALSGGRERWRERPWRVLLFGLVVDALALTGVAQIVVQSFIVRSFCAPCLSAAGISFLNAWLAQDEVAAALAEQKRGVLAGREASV